jgi:hypothetical protein
MEGKILKNLIYLGCVTAGLCLLSGCGGVASGHVEASGTVTLDGTPVAGASVVFVPVTPDAGEAGFAITDEDGRYELGTGEEKNGGVPGSYMVQVSKTVETEGGAAAPVDLGEDAEHAEEGEGANVTWINSLPATYASPKTSGITIDIPEDGSSELDIKLVSGA